MSLILQSDPKDIIVITEKNNNEIFLKYSSYNSSTNEIEITILSKNDFNVKHGNTLYHYLQSTYGMDKLKDYKKHNYFEIKNIKRNINNNNINKNYNLFKKSTENMVYMQNKNE